VPVSSQDKLGGLWQEEHFKFFMLTFLMSFLVPVFIILKTIVIVTCMDWKFQCEALVETYEQSSTVILCPVKGFLGLNAVLRRCGVGILVLILVLVT